MPGDSGASHSCDVASLVAARWDQLLDEVDAALVDGLHAAREAAELRTRSHRRLRRHGASDGALAAALATLYDPGPADAGTV